MSAEAKCVLLGTFDEHGKPVKATWCGRANGMTSWAFVDPTHALLTHRTRPGSIAVCTKCLRAMRAVIDRELGGSQ